MDYSYKTMCDSSLQQIRRSENKRQELDHKLQKMYQEKSECEKSIIKTLQNQQKEDRRRSERNENILRQLERIDYQAASLAAKTERLKALKKQYERYLLTLWNRKRQGIHPTMNLHNARYASPPLSTKQDGSSAYQSSHYNPYGNEFSFNYSRFQVLPTHAINPSPTLNYHRNQSYFRELPSSQTENSIRTNNYRTTGAPHPQFFYPSTVQIRDDLTQIPQYQQSVEKKFFYQNDSAINKDDMNLPTTINSINSRNDLQQQNIVPQFSPKFDDKLTAPIYQRNYQPENHNFNSDLKMSEALYGKSFITLAPSSAEMLNKNHSEISPSISNMTDGEETESDAEKCNITRRSIRRNNEPVVETKGDGEVSFTKHHDFIDNLHFQPPECSVIRPQGKQESSGEEIEETVTITESMTNENMHQIWEKVVPVDVVDTQVSSNFVIPKIIVETTPVHHPSMNENQNSIHEIQETTLPEKLLNHEMKKHSTDNQQNGSLSSRPQLASTVNNNLPLEKAGSSIYHYDKQPLSDEQQNHTPSSVEHELGSFNDIKISDCTKEKTTATQNMTYEFEIKTNNSLAEGNIDEGSDGGKETINNINDDKNQSATSTTVALNDKIHEIYRKIERIEGDYYDEKGKIIENFERKTSTSSISDSAKLETQSMIDSGDGKYDAAENKAQENFQHETTSNLLEPECAENLIYDENEWKSDQHQSEIIENWNESKSRENSELNYSYGSQQNQELSGLMQPIEGPEQLTEPEYNSQMIPGDIQQYDQYPYEQTQQPFNNNDPHQQSEYVYSHHDNTQQEANNYNPSYDTQSDSNYQQNNYDEAQENPSNYTNDSAEVYYDYDQNLQQQFQTSPQNSHQQPAQYFYENVDNKAETNQEHSNENNYGYAENFNEISDGSTSYNVKEYEKYETEDITTTHVYESQATNETTLGNANYESLQFAQESNENSEQMNVESYERDESFLTTTTSESSKPEVNENANRNVEGEIQPTKLDDVRIVKQLLNSESDDELRSNLLQTSIKEEVDESDFDFSTG